MSLVPALLQAIVHLDGEALVLHVGEKPYVVSRGGQVDLATRGLTLDAVVGIVNQLLPADSQNTLDEFGAVKYQLPPLHEFRGEQFIVVVARGGDDVWAEIRRRHVPDEDAVPLQLFAPTAGPPAVAAQAARVRNDDLAVPTREELYRTSAAAPDPDEVEIELPSSAPPAVPIAAAPPPPPPPPAPPIRSVPPAVQAAPPRPPAIEPTPPIHQAPPPPPVRRAPMPDPMPAVSPAAFVSPPVPLSPPAPPIVAEAFAAPVASVQAPQARVAAPPPQAVPTFRPATSAEAHALPIPAFAPVPVLPAIAPAAALPAPEVAAPRVLPPPVPTPPAPSAEAYVAPMPAFVPPPAVSSAVVQQVSPSPAPAAPFSGAYPAPVAAFVPPQPLAPSAASEPFDPLPAVVLPLTRNPFRPDAPPPLAEQALSTLDNLLRLAAARGASGLFLSSGARPSVRVDGEMQALDGAPIHEPGDVESLLLTLMPERNAEALRTGLASEWICDITDVGRVRCMSFRDHRGPGGVFRIMPVRATTAEQLGLTRAIQSLADNPEGLVIVSGPRSSGKHTLMSALVDLINRTRRDHVISIESEINFVHERNGSFVSQREVRGTDEMLAVAGAALREDPDVLVLEELRSAALMTLALDAAASGRLVIGGFPAPTASGAIDRIIDLYPSEYRRQVQVSLAQNLRGVVAQVLLRKIGGGRLGAREVLLNTPAVRSVLAEGRTSQLPNVIEGGRVHGMSPLNDALVGFVQSGAVDVREAYRRAVDRPGFLALLKRQGLDISGVEKHA